MSFRSFVEGGLASVLAGCSTHPFDVIKVRMQLDQHATLIASSSSSVAAGAAGGAALTIVHQYRGCVGGPISTGVRLVQAEGFQGLFTGLSATILRQSLYSTTRMGLYEALKRRWREPTMNGSLPPFKKVAAALIAGAVGAAVGNPADVAMVRMQADTLLPPQERRSYRNVVDALARMVKQEGVQSLWTGSSLSIQRAMVVTVCQLVTYDQIKEALLSTGLWPNGIALYLAASIGAGVVASVASNPIDVIKTRMMNMSREAGKYRPYNGPWDCAVKTVRVEGALALYKGFLPTLSRQGPFTVVLFLTLEEIRRLLKSL